MDRFISQHILCSRRWSSCKWLVLMLLLLQSCHMLVSGLRMPGHASGTHSLSSSSSSSSPSSSSNASSSSSSVAFVAPSPAGSSLQRSHAINSPAVPAVVSASSSPSSAATALPHAARITVTTSSLSAQPTTISSPVATSATAFYFSVTPRKSFSPATTAATSAATGQQVKERISATSNTEEIAPLARPASLAGKIAFVAGVGDSNGYGWAIARELAAAGAQVAVGTWPPVLSLFKKSLETGKFDEDRVLPDQTLLTFQKIYPLDAAFDTPQDVPQDVKENKRYAGVDGYTISEVAERVKRDLGGLDILVHSLANGPEVANPLLKTSRKGYLAAVSNSSYSMVSLLQHFAPIMKTGGSALTLSYVAGERVIPGYGGGMSSAKAALESDTRTLAWEAGQRYGVRVNAISAGPLRSRAAQAIGKDGERFIDYAVEYSLNNAPLRRHLHSDDVAAAALFLLSPMARAVTGVTLYVDNGLHAMGHAVDSRSLPQPQQSTS